MTRWDDIYEPESIDGDYMFAPAASDAPYRTRDIYRTRDHDDLAGLILLAVLASGIVALIAVVARRARARKTSA